MLRESEPEWKMKLFYIGEVSLIGVGTIQNTVTWHWTWTQHHMLAGNTLVDDGSSGRFRGVWGETLRGTGGDYCWRTWGRRMSEQPEWLRQTTQFIPHSYWKHKADIPRCCSRLDIKRHRCKAFGWQGSYTFFLSRFHCSRFLFDILIQKPRCYLCK